MGGDWNELLHQQHRAFRLDQAAECGRLRRHVRVRVDRGQWTQLYPRVFAATAEPGWLTWASGALLYAEVPVGAAADTAAAAHGLIGVPRLQPAIIIPASARIVVPHLTVIRSRQFQSLRFVEVQGLRALSIEDVVITRWGTLRTRDARLGWLTTVLRDGRTTCDRLRSRLRYYPRVPGRAEMRAALDDYAGGAHTQAEQDFVIHVRAGGFPEPELQLRVRLHGEARILDGGWPRYSTYYEIDGWLGHTELLERERDNRVGNALNSEQTLLRFTNRQARDRRYVLLTTATALAARGCPEAESWLRRFA